MKQVNFLLIFCLIILFSKAQSGTLDESFGNNGTVITAVNTNSEGLDCQTSILQKDGKLLTAGGQLFLSNVKAGFRIARYHINGSLDSSFGNNGAVFTDFNETNYQDFGYEEVYSLVIQPDNKIIAAGVVNTDYFNTTDGPAQNVNLALCRYLTNGTVDSSFGENGKLITDFGGYEYGDDMLLQVDGKIVVGGIVADSQNPDGPFHFLLVRYLPGGQLDESFGDNGKVITVLNSFNTDLLRALALQPDGKIIAAGSTKFVSGSFTTEKFALTRYKSNGSLDSSFGDKGVVITDFGPKEEVIEDITLQPDGKIIAAGNTYTSILNSNMGIARYNVDGSLDQVFGTGGKVNVIFDQGASRAESVALQKNGKIVIGGTIATQTFEDFALARCDNDGSLDSSFGTNGKTVSDFETDEYGNTCLLQNDGKILLTGASTTEQTNGYVIARYIGDPTHPLITKIKRWIRRHILNFQDVNPNAGYYVIEKSNNANTNFTAVGRIQAESAKLNPSGNAIHAGAQSKTQGNIYSYTLPNNQLTTTYYRIKTVNKDNSFAYSSAISSSDDAAVAAASLKIYPNPAKDKINIQSAKEVNLKLQNSFGQIIITQKIKGSGSIDISKLPVGIYYVIDTETGESFKVVKE